MQLKWKYILFSSGMFIYIYTYMYTHISSKPICSNVSFKANVFRLIFYMDDLYDVRGLLKSSIVIVDFSFYVHSYVPYMRVCSYVGQIYIYKYYIFLAWSLDHYEVSFSVITVYILKPILSDVSIAILAFFCISFAWNTLFHPLF